MPILNEIVALQVERRVWQDRIARIGRTMAARMQISRVRRDEKQTLQNRIRKLDFYKCIRQADLTSSRQKHRRTISIILSRVIQHDPIARRTASFQAGRSNNAMHSILPNARRGCQDVVFSTEAS